jgi:hypothetical protein
MPLSWPRRSSSSRFSDIVCGIIVGGFHLNVAQTSRLWDRADWKSALHFGSTHLKTALGRAS